MLHSRRCSPSLCLRQTHQQRLPSSLPLIPSSTKSLSTKPFPCRSVPADFDYDVFVIGGGSGGVRAARTAAEHGAKVALAELPLAFKAGPDKGGVGGTCVLRGCVPKKLMLFASAFATEAQASSGYGWRDQSVGQLDWGAFLEAKRQELTRLNSVYKDNLSKAGVELLEGRAKVVGKNEVKLDGSDKRTLRVKNIVIATGGQATCIGIPGAELAIISDEVLELEKLPSKVTLIGGGYIGMEFAGFFARLGCEVHVIARQALPLAPRFDEEVCEFFAEQCTKASGINLHMRRNPTAIEKAPDGKLTVKIEPANKDKRGSGSSGDSGSSDSGSSGGSSEISGNNVVVLAVGRAASTKGLGLEDVGVELGGKGSVQVDEHSRTNIPSIWAVGDVTSRIALTPVAIMEGQAVGQSVATGALEAPDYTAVPSACFSWPFVATVGLTEQEVLQKEGLSAEVYTSTFTPLKARLAARAEGAVAQQCFVKMLVEVGSGKVLGLHMVGEDAPEIIQGFALAVKLGLTKQQVDSLVGIHPTSAEEVVGLKGPARVVGGGGGGAGQK